MAHFLGTHFGAYAVERDAQGGVRLAPFPGDPAPSPLGEGFLELARHPLRVMAPCVREGWWRRVSGGEGRGREAFLAVGWDALLDRLAREIDETRGLHGNRAIFAGSYGWASAGRFHHAPSQLKRALNLLGGFTSSVNTYSYGAAGVLLPHVLGDGNRDACDTAPYWDDMERHCRLLVAFGGFREGNAMVEAGGCGRHEVRCRLERLARNKCRIVVLSPSRGDVPSWLDAEHIFIRPNSDAAVLLAMARSLRVEGRVDTKFLATRTEGYNRFATYLDSGAPTPGEAEAASGVPTGTIVALARDIATTPSTLTLAWSLQRARFGEQPYWAAIALMAMTGRLGAPGLGVAFGLGSVGSVGAGVERLSGPSVPQGRNRVPDVIPVARISDLLEGESGAIAYDGRRLSLPDIRMVWWSGGNPFHHHQDLHRLLRAWRRPRTIVVQEPFWTATARHSDIVLPSALPSERDDLAASSRDNWIIASRAIAPPPPDVTSDHEALARLLARFDLAEAFTEGRDERGWIAHLYAGYRARHAELPDFATFWDVGAAALAGAPSAEDPRERLRRFVADPVGAPLSTQSGRIELFSRRIAAFGYDDCPGHPVWRAPEESSCAPLSGEWPLHLLTPQPAGRLHSQLDAARASREGKRNGRERLQISASDARARAIGSGDTVRVFNTRGALLAVAQIEEGLMPGVVVLPTGAWLDIDASSGLDLSGNPNVLTPDIGSSQLSQGPSPNSCLVEVECWRGAEPAPRTHRPPNVRPIGEISS